MRPKILIACGFDDEDGERYFVLARYVYAVTMAGGLPLLVPGQANTDALMEALQIADGLLLPGGWDVDPSHYGELPHPNLGKVVPQVDAIDIPAARYALENDLPVLGICRGSQVLNVAAGGSLIQDIPSQVLSDLFHRQKGDLEQAVHHVTLAPKSRLAQVLGSNRLFVNSSHHQAVKQCGQGLVVSGQALDGVVESIEAPGHPFALGVQWHPEAMLQTDPAQARLFVAFVEAAKHRAEGRRS